MKSDSGKLNNPRVRASSGNVFADLGLPNAEEKQTKVRLAAGFNSKFNQIIAGRKLSQMVAARSLNVNQPKISALANYQVDGFSVERLMNLLTALDRDVDIVIRPKPRSRKAGRIAVRAA
jgi:predicted XRE-type DNA-binding protein